MCCSYGGYPPQQQGYPPQQYGGYNQGPPVRSLYLISNLRRASASIEALRADAIGDIIDQRTDMRGIYRCNTSKAHLSK